MPNLKELRNRIRSVNNTQQITKAMKMVAAAKLRRAQERAMAPRAYTESTVRMVRTLATALTDREGMPPLLVGRGEIRRVELMVMTADRGLCGSFNSGVIRGVRQRVAELEARGMQVTLSFVGRKGHDVLKRQFADKVRATFTDVGKDLDYEKAEKVVAADLLKAYREERFDACILVYNTFQSAMTQVLTWRQVIPVPIEQKSDDANLGNYLYEPSDEELLDELLPKNVAVQVYQALAESEASEHGSRMTAMDNAVRNAQDMIRKLTTQFNRTRQAAITTELMEIIGGAESLKG